MRGAYLSGLAAAAALTASGCLGGSDGSDQASQEGEALRAAAQTGLIDAADRRILAEGETVSGTEWALATGRSRDPLGRGSSPCLSLATFGSRGPQSSAGCRPDLGHGELGAGIGGDAKGGVLYGTAPETLAKVQVVAGGDTYTEHAIDPEGEVPGRLYVVDSPGDFRSTTIAFFDTSGQRLNEPQQTIWSFMRDRER